MSPTRKADCYILRFNRIPEFKMAVHLIVPAPIKARSLRISLRGLLTEWSQYYNRFDYIGRRRAARGN